MNDIKINKKKILILAGLVVFTACHNTKTETPKEEKTTAVSEKSTETKTKETEQPVEYSLVKGDSISGLSIPEFEINSSYKVGKNYLVSGYYKATEDGKFNKHDSEKDNGDRILFLDENKKILYISAGKGDVYVYDPNFFTNKVNNNVLVFARLGYEYNFGGDLYLIKNGNIKFLGNMDIEPNTEDKSTVDVMKISQKGQQFKVTFDYDSLVVNPASAYPKPFKNEGTHYIYDGKKLKFYKK